MKLLFPIIFCFSIYLQAQDDLLNEIDTDSTGTEYASAAFKGLKIVNFESTKLAGNNELKLIVSHRFGSIKNGIDTFFGLDNAVTRLNFVYGITDAINIGVSRSSFLKVYDVTTKYRLLKQKINGFPLTIVGFNAILINTSLKKENFPLLEFSDKLGYTHAIFNIKKD